MNDLDAEIEARAEYEALRGRVVLVSEVCCYTEQDDSADVPLDPPVAFRVVGTRAEDTAHWNDDWLDPYLDVEPVDPADPQLAGLRSFWIDGTSINPTTGERQPSPCWRLAEEVS